MKSIQTVIELKIVLHNIIKVKLLCIDNGIMYGLNKYIFVYL